MATKRLFFLFELHMSNQANDLERAELMQLLTDPANEADAKELLGEAWKEFEFKNLVFTPLESTRMLKNILENGEILPQPKKWNWSIVFKAAAVLLLVSSIGLLWLKQTKHDQKLSTTSFVKNKKSLPPVIAPGGDKAILTLANGTKIALNDLSDGKVVNEAGVRITKTADGQLIYTVQKQGNLPENNSKVAELEFNTITTPRGGQYQINLPDGSKVWLNSASSLKFPTVFLSNERRVELSGEAYFEISKQKRGNARLPFKVVAYNGTKESQEVNVLGTHFNIHAYGNEEDSRTTLLEGSVEITNLNSNSINILRPGEQAILTTGKTKISSVDIDEVMAWKNGKFIFDNRSLSDIMKQLERWYNIDVDYAKIPETHYHGSISKQVSLSEVLDMLELTGNLKFRIVPSAVRNRIEITKK